MPDYKLQPFPIFQRHQLFFKDLGVMPYQCNISQNLISYFDLARSVPIKKPYSLHQSALVGDQNGIWILSLYHSVSEEFDHNVPNYISSQIMWLKIAAFPKIKNRSKLTQGLKVQPNARIPMNASEHRARCGSLCLLTFLKFNPHLWVPLYPRFPPKVQ